MNIVKAYAKPLNLTPEIGRRKLLQVEYAARISHRSEHLQNENTLERFINAVVVKHGDWSVTEHESVSVEMLLDRGCTHELVRHRIAAYTQESTRFVNYTKQMESSYIYPIVLDRLEKFPESCTAYQDWLAFVTTADRGYQAMLKHGWRPEEARSLLPNALASKIMVTMNLRSWRHVFLMRSSIETHPQLREQTGLLLEEFKRCIPIIYDDITPDERQVTNLGKGR